MTTLVTGGAGGLGIEVARAFLRRGRDVALVDLAERVTEVAASLLISTPGRAVAGFVADTTEPRSVGNAWTKAEEEVGPIDVVVNSAGIVVRGGIAGVSTEEWQRCLNVNLTGPFLVCRRAAESWLASNVKGAIVNVASISAMKAAGPPVGSVAYDSAKAGLIGLTQHLAVELGPHGIRTNAVAPGSFVSPMNRDRLSDPHALEEAERMVPLGRVATAEEVAGPVVYLALDASYINGAVLVCDGGTVVRM